MKLKYFHLLLLLFGVSYLGSPAVSAEERGIFTGASLEFNNHNKDGGATGGGLMAAYQVNRQFAFGIRASFFAVTGYYAGNLSSFEPKAFFRYNLPWAWANGLFAQLEAGSVVYFYHNDVFPAFSGGLGIGWRYGFTDVFFIEPALRFGYPFMWGAGLTAGLSFPFSGRRTER